MKRIELISDNTLEEKDVLTAQEAGEFLGYTAESVKKLAREGKIPGQKIGGGPRSHWRFSRPQLLRFIEGKYLS